MYNLPSSAHKALGGRALLEQRAAGQPASLSPPLPAVPATRRPPSLLLPRPPACAARQQQQTRPGTSSRVIAAAAARKGAAADGAAAAAPRRAPRKKAEAPPAAPTSQDDDDDEPTPAQILAQVTRRIRDHGKAGRIRDAIAELASLSERGLQPDRIAATALVAACAARPTPQNMTVAEGVFEELFGDGGGNSDYDDADEGGPLLQPDEVTFAVLLRGYGAASPPQWPKIDATLGRMRRAFGIAPTATSYNALLEVCVRTGDMDRAMDVVDRMADDGVEPDAQTVLTCGRKRALRAYARKALEI